jgi:hypothetical protein
MNNWLGKLTYHRLYLYQHRTRESVTMPISYEVCKIVSRANKITIFFFFLLLFVSPKISLSQTQQIRLQTVLPAPMLTYNYFRLMPRQDMSPSECTGKEGTMYVSNTIGPNYGKLMICDGNGPPDPPTGLWTESSNVLYLKDFATPNIRVGIGTTGAPQGKLEISSQNSFGLREGVIFDPRDAQGNNRLELYEFGDPLSTTVYQTGVNFGNARILMGRNNMSTGSQTLTFNMNGANTLCINANNQNRIGINICSTTNEKVTINGHMRTTNLHLKMGASPVGLLKVTSIGGNTYAVLAP